MITQPLSIAQGKRAFLIDNLSNTSKFEPRTSNIAEDTTAKILIPYK